MARRVLPSLLMTSCLIATALGQDGDKLISGPQPGMQLPGPCEVFNINGTKYKGRFHCLVCEYGNNPVVMIFTQEPKEGEDGPLNALVRRLEGSLEQHRDANLRAFMVVLSKDFRTSATDKIEDTDKIIQEIEERNKLLRRLEERAGKMKSMILGVTGAEGPKIYSINPKAEVTVVFYNRFKVVENLAFLPGKLTEDDVDKVITKVDTTLNEIKKRPAKK